MAVVIADELVDTSAPIRVRAERTLFLKDSERLVKTPSVTDQLIICIDCAGPHDTPRKTQLTKQGNCAKCGGRSYILASTIPSKIKRRFSQ